MAGTRNATACDRALGVACRLQCNSRMMMRYCSLIAALMAWGCASPGDAAPPNDALGTPDASACLGDPRTMNQHVFFGTEEPRHVPLALAQRNAIGTIGGCSGTVIASGWVLSAQHCRLSTNDLFCVGVDGEEPEACARVIRAIDHPDVDLTLAELDPATPLSEVVPIPILTELLDESWVGRFVEAGGYGLQEDFTTNRREFTAEPIVSVGAELLTVDGHGYKGLCAGDSGGPALVIAYDGTVRTVGALWGGDASCVGRDSFTRVDNQAAWVEAYTGPTQTPAASPGCGSVTSGGQCVAGGDRVMYCGPQQILAVEDCGRGRTCGWTDAAHGFRCLDGDDPCEGVDGIGTCDGDVARWCDHGQIRSRTCGQCGEACALELAAGGAHCAPAPS